MATLVSLLGLRIQLGARRRRLRRELFEELELERVLLVRPRTLGDNRPDELPGLVAYRVSVLEHEYQHELTRDPSPVPDIILFLGVPAVGAMLATGTGLAVWSLSGVYLALVAIAGGVAAVSVGWAAILVIFWWENRGPHEDFEPAVYLGSEYDDERPDGDEDPYPT